MKKTLSFMLLAAMFTSLVLCPSVTAYAEETAPMPGGRGEALPFGTGYVGQVSEIDGYLVTLTLGSFEGAANMPEGDMPERPEGDMQMPSGDMQPPQGGGQPPMGDMQMPEGGGMQPPMGEGQPPMGDMQMSGGYQQMSDTSMQQPGEKDRMHGGRDRGGFGAGAEGAEPGMGFGGMGFVPGEETMSFDLENVSISRQSENGTEDCAFEDIVLGDILVIETDEDGNVLSVLIISPTEAGEAPPEKPEDTV